MTPPDPAVLARILATLPTADALVVSSATEPAWLTRQRRLEARDAAIHLAREALAHLTKTRAADEIVCLLVCAASGKPPSDEQMRETVVRILQLNGGRPLQRGAIFNVLTGRRTPVQ